MPDVVNVWPEAPKAAGDTITKQAVIELPANNREVLWYRIPLSWENALTESSDPFAIATVFVAMRLGADLRIHGTVSPSLLSNLEEFRQLWHCWMPHMYQQGATIANHESESVVAPYRHALACFSGGIDSCFTVYRHAKGLCGRQRQDIRSGVHLQWSRGGCSATITPTVRKITAMLDSLDIGLILMESNWRGLWRSLHIPWLDCHGAAYIAGASMLQAGFRMILFASTYSYDTLRPYGSTPVGDILLSSEALHVRHDGAAFSRVEKAAVLSQWPEAMRNLHVCWEGPDRHRNCGVCEKCIRTVLDFRVNGVSLPPAFEKDVSDDLVASVPIGSDIQLHELESILRQALCNGLAHESWVRALARRVRRERRKNSIWSQLSSRLKLRARMRHICSLVRH